MRSSGDAPGPPLGDTQTLNNTVFGNKSSPGSSIAVPKLEGSFAVKILPRIRWEVNRIDFKVRSNITEKLCSAPGLPTTCEIDYASELQKNASLSRHTAGKVRCSRAHGRAWFLEGRL